VVPGHHVDVSATAPLPAYLVRGDDSVLRDEAVRVLLHELVGDADIALVVESFEQADDTDTAPLVDAARTPPFLTDRRVVVGRDVSAYSSDALRPLLSYLDDPLPTSHVVLVTGDRGRLSTKLVNAVKKIGHVIDAGVPTQRGGRSTWLAEHLEGAPVRMEPAAVKVLDGHLGDDLGRLANLLEVLAAAYGRGSRIGVDDLEPFLGGSGSVPPWELTDAIDAGNTSVALDLLHRMMGAGERHPLVLLSTLHSHYARMLRLDGADAADERAAAAALGMTGSTYPARKALTQGRRLGSRGVAEAIRLLAEADLDLRKLRRDWPEDLVMEVLVARLSRLGRGGR
jgi:DNA polymerase III subunit delta